MSKLQLETLGDGDFVITRGKVPGCQDFKDVFSLGRVQNDTNSSKSVSKLREEKSITRRGESARYCIRWLKVNT